MVGKFSSFLKGLRWVLSALLFILLGFLGWYGWTHRDINVWITFGIVFLLFFILVGWGGKLVALLLRRLGRKLSGPPGKITYQVVDFAQQQTEKLTGLPVKDLGKKVSGILPGAKSTINQGRKGKKPSADSITWTKSPPPPPISPPPAPNQVRYCYACGSSVSPGAKFCGRCGAQLLKK